jgi:hypothetical protein
MTNNPDYRLYLESEFEKVTLVLKSIEAQTLKTNSRVTHLEENVSNLNLANIEHIVNCPAMPKIENIERGLLEYEFFKKYPKLMVLIIVVFVIGMLFSVIKSMELSTKLTEVQSNLKTEIRAVDGVSKVTRGGYVKFNDYGLSDSIKISP